MGPIHQPPRMGVLGSSNTGSRIAPVRCRSELCPKRSKDCYWLLRALERIALFGIECSQYFLKSTLLAVLFDLGQHRAITAT
jgi:hypothetical protein